MAAPSVPPEVLRLGGRAIGSKGSGKTLYAAWWLYWLMQRGVGAVAFDPMGKVTEYLFGRLRRSGDQALWRRVRWVPVGGHALKADDGERETWVCPYPFLYGEDGDELHDRTARVVEFWKRLSPGQENAPILGMPAIERTAHYAGMPLAAMGNQLVPDAALLLDDPERWEGRVREAYARHPWALTAPARYLLKTYPRMSRSDQRTETLSFRNKVDPYVMNRRLAGLWGANAWGVPLEQAQEGTVVLLDFSGMAPGERWVAMVWLFARCMEIFRRRAHHPLRDTLPVGFVVDELSALAPRANPLLEQDFDELLVQLGRNFNIWTLLTYQEVTQPSEDMRAVLDQTGWTLYGSTGRAESAKAIAELLHEYDPHLLKDRRTAIVEVPDQFRRGDWWQEQVRTFYTPDEQLRLNTIEHRRRAGLRFALAMADGPGAAPVDRGEISVVGLQQSQDFTTRWLPEEKRRLILKHGRPLSEVLDEIVARLPVGATVGGRGEEVEERPRQRSRRGQSRRPTVRFQEAAEGPDEPVALADRPPPWIN